MFFSRIRSGRTGFVLLLAVLLGNGRPPARVNASDARIETILGTGQSEPGPLGQPLATNVGNPFGVEIGPDGGLYVCEVSNHRLWRLARNEGRLTIVAGSGQAGYSGDGGPAVEALMREPYEVRFDRDGNLYVVEMQNHVVRKIDRRGIISTVAGTGQAGFSGDGGPAVQATLNQPHSIALDDRGQLFIADIGNHRIRAVDLRTGTITTLAGNGEKQLPVAGETARGRPVLGPRALFVTDRTLWVALREGHSLWRLDLDEGSWQPVAGSGQRGYSGDGGPALAATLNGPKGVAIGPAGDVFLADTENQVIRQIDRQTGIITTLAGSGPEQRGSAGDGGPARAAQLNRPHGICVDAQGHIIIGDSENHRVREVNRAP